MNLENYTETAQSLVSLQLKPYPKKGSWDELQSVLGKSLSD